jgi:hypothetical protein
MTGDALRSMFLQKSPLTLLALNQSLDRMRATLGTNDALEATLQSHCVFCSLD